MQRRKKLHWLISSSFLLMLALTGAFFSFEPSELIVEQVEGGEQHLANAFRGHEVVVLYSANAFLLGWADDLALAIHHQDNMPARLQAQQQYAEALKVGLEAYPHLCMAASAFGILLSAPVFGVAWLARRIPKRNIGFHLAFWSAWGVFLVFHLGTRQTTGFYMPLPHEWVLFPILAALLGLVSATRTPKTNANPRLI